MGPKVLKPLTAILLVTVLFFGSIFAAQALGIYQVKPPSIETGQVTSPAELKGYLTIEEAIQATQLSQKEFYKAFKIPDHVPLTTKMSEIPELVPGYDFHAVKETLE